ncbi:MAG: phosphate regulon sensor histidine kinase PhoR [Neisseria sp.]|nr:phosphate regulon sensor histidine kinase PhoR [Neisseria sp.]
MQNFFWHSVKTLALFLLPTLLVGLLWGPKIAVELYAVCVSIWLLLHLYQIGLLLRWLRKPKLSAMPSGIGIWQHIFATLQQQSKSRKKRKHKINTVLQRFYKATAAMPNGVMILDADGRINWMNQPAAGHFNLNREQDLHGILINLVRVPGFQEFVEAARENEEMKVRLPHVDGQRTLLVTAIPFEDDLKMIASQDVTRLEQLISTRSDFVANVSHELRTPLTVINGFLETLHDDPEVKPADRHSFIALMQKEGLRMQSLLSDLLVLSRLENDDSDEEKEEVHLSALCRQLLEGARALSGGQHDISDDITPNLWINGIQRDLYNGLSNILYNAVRYTPAGGKIHLALSLDETDGRSAIRFSVRDNGAGIAPEHLPRLTERFYRVDAGRSRQKGGTGLGLAITKHVLAEHDTKLEITSTLGAGSEFSARFAALDAPVMLAED